VLTPTLDLDTAFRISRQLKFAALDVSLQRALLEDLGFLARPTFWRGLAYALDQLRAWISGLLVWIRRVGVPLIFICVAMGIIIYVATLQIPWYLGILGVLFAMHRWSVVQTGRAVDEAMKRKEMANKMIVDYASLLIPYVGAGVLATDVTVMSSAHTSEDKVRISMFVYTELDNLEFVFMKSRYGLMEWDYALRAIDIFLARSQNPHFASLARRLVTEGRYSPDFTSTAEKLIAVSQLTNLRTRAR
jgi:hypothetical protein